MRSGALMIALVAALAAAAGCHKPTPVVPAWPAPSTTEDDGGESLAPRTTSVAAAVEKSADATTSKAEDKPAEDKKPEAKPAAEPDADADASDAEPTSTQLGDDDEVIISDEIIIEIED